MFKYMLQSYTELRKSAGQGSPATGSAASTLAGWLVKQCGAGKWTARARSGNKVQVRVHRGAVFI